MSEFSGTWSGAQEAGAELARLHEAMVQAAQSKGMHECGDVVKVLGAGNAPKKTGKLAGQWGTIIAREGDTIRLQVGPAAPYARRNVIGYRGLKIRRSRSTGRLRVKSTGGGRGRNASPPHRAWLLKTFEESMSRFTGIIAAAVNPSRIKGGGYG